MFRVDTNLTTELAGRYSLVDEAFDTTKLLFVFNDQLKQIGLAEWFLKGDRS